MVQVTTKSGFVVDINNEAADDMRFVEQLSNLDDNPLNLPKVIEIVLGAEGKEALYKHLEERDGRATVAATTEMFSEILELGGEDLKK